MRSKTDALRLTRKALNLGRIAGGLHGLFLLWGFVASGFVVSISEKLWGGLPISSRVALDVSGVAFSFVMVGHVGAWWKQRVANHHEAKGPSFETAIQPVFQSKGLFAPRYSDLAVGDYYFGIENTGSVPARNVTCYMVDFKTPGVAFPPSLGKEALLVVLGDRSVINPGDECRFQAFRVAPGNDGAPQVIAPLGLDIGVAVALGPSPLHLLFRATAANAARRDFAVAVWRDGEGDVRVKLKD